MLLHLFITVVGAVSVAAAADAPSAVGTGSPRIILDPGHGGRDTGARGPTGLMEKTVSLELARQLALKLEPEYRVVLTRSDDYSVDLPQRTATANQSKAELLISIHTASGFLHRTAGIGVYYYLPLKGSAGTVSAETVGTQRWHAAPLRHRKASMALAESLSTYLSKMESSGGRNIQGLPLKILEGADLPAVLVEIGHITHPATEMNLSASTGRERLSQALAKGVRHYAEKTAFTGRLPSDPAPEP